MPLFGPPNVEKLKSKRDVNSLIKALGYQTKSRDETSVIRVKAARALGELRDVQAVEPLIAALKDDDFSLRQAAATALGWLQDARAVGPLMLSLEDVKAQKEASSALAAIGAPAVTPLLAALKNKDKSIRQLSADALGKTGWQPRTDETAVLYWVAKQNWAECVKIGSPAVEPLISLLNVHPEIRPNVIGMLGELKDARAAGPLLQSLGDVRVQKEASAALAAIGAPAVTLLIAALKHKDKSTRRLSADALDKIGWQPGTDETGVLYWVAKRHWAKCVEIGSPAVEPLLSLLNVDPEIRQEVIEMLGELKDARAVEPLLAALKDGDLSVCLAAAKALGKIGDARAVKPLIAALEDEHATVRWEAVEALGKIGDARAVKPLLAQLNGDDQFAQTRAAEALGKIGDARAVKPLIAALEGRGSGLPGAATKALVRMGAVAVLPLVAALKADNRLVRLSAADALGNIGDARAVQPLIAALKSQDVSTSVAAALALGRLKDPSAVEALAATLPDAGGNLRETIADVLGETGDTRAVEPLIAILDDAPQDLTSEGVEKVRRVVRTLGEIRDSRAVEPLIGALKKEYSPKKDIAQALGKIGDARAVGPLLSMLALSHYAIRYADERRAAAEALLAFYRSGKLDETDRQTILAQRSVIVAPHRDSSDGCAHTDEGIGVDFPL